LRLRAGALALLSLAAALTTVELFARLRLPPPRHFANEALIFDRELGFRGEPGARSEGFDAQGAFSIELDEQGLRRRVRSAAAAGSAREIELVGDSFVVAQGVRDDDTLASQLEARLAASGQPARVRELAIVDYGTAQEWMLWRAQREGRPADVTVLALYPANDLANNTLALAGRTAVSPGDYLRPYLVPRPDGGFERRFAHPLREALRGASRAFAVLEHRMLAFGVARRIEWLEPWPARESESTRLHAGLAPREELELYREPAPGSAWAEAWNTTLQLLRAFRNDVRAGGGRFVVLVIPSLLEVEEEATAVHLDLLARRHAGRGLREIVDWNLPSRRLAGFFADEGIEAFALLDAFRDAARHGVSLFVSDGHFSAPGHALAAARLADALGAAEPSAPAPPRSDGPTSILPPPDASPAQLDFRAAANEAYLVRGGWLAHSASGETAGWLPGARAALVLPARRGDLVLRGHVPDDAVLPIAAELRLEETRASVELAAPGPFELRISAPLAADEPRWVDVEIELSSRTRIGRAPATVYVESVGFER
jgi:lysophospholipase L1-like esterase